jgi:acyl-CoA reductase-like NAD-dependent aldehyde dehydrogenase
MNKPAELKLGTVPVWINGKPVSTAKRYGEVFNPAIGQVTKRVVFSDASIVDAAVKAASAARLAGALCPLAGFASCRNSL